MNLKSKINDKKLLFIVILLIIVSLYDLFSPPLSSTSWRQTQTAMLTTNFTSSNFNINGLYVNLLGDAKPIMIYEFPIYEFLVGLFYKTISFNSFWGKLVSLLSSLGTVIILYNIVNKYYGQRYAFASGIFFVFIPIGMLVRTSFQPDSLSLLFLVVSLFYLIKWRENKKKSGYVLFLLFILLSALIKFPIIVPYIPFILFLILINKNNKFELPSVTNILIGLFVFIIPFFVWYIYFVQHLTNPIFLKGTESMFLIGDLRRYLSISYYIKPIFIFLFYVFSGTGLLFFLYNLIKPNSINWILFAGIIFYLVIVPTSSEQHYYQYAITPIAALFLGKGWLKLYDKFKLLKIGKLFLGILLIMYGLIFIVSSSYLLRQDKVFETSAKKVGEVVNKSDLILSLALHDRVYEKARWYPEMFYLSGCKGWDINFIDYKNTAVLNKEILKYGHQGAKYLVITWYSKDLEPWFNKFIPKI
ncbi:MAG: ArnT family glycosyltransferase, partial [Ignavibacteriaceae bacterium]